MKKVMPTLWKNIKENWKKYNEAFKGSIPVFLNKLYDQVAYFYGTLFGNNEVKKSQGGMNVTQAFSPNPNMNVTQAFSPNPNMPIYGPPNMPIYGPQNMPIYGPPNNPNATAAAAAGVAATVAANTGFFATINNMLSTGITMFTSNPIIGTAAGALISIAFYGAIKLYTYLSTPKVEAEDIPETEQADIQDEMAKGGKVIDTLIQELMTTNYSDIEWELNNYITNTRNDITIYNKLIKHANRAKQEELSVFLRKLAECVSKAVGMLEIIKKNPDIINYEGTGIGVREKIRNKIGRYGTIKDKTDKKIQKTMTEVYFFTFPCYA